MINLATKSLTTSSPIVLRLSSLNRRRNCLTGLYLGSTLRVCSTSSLGTPGMSEGFHAKMSRFSRMNSMSALSYFGSKFVLILNCLDESLGTKSTSLVSAADLNFRAGSWSVVFQLSHVCRINIIFVELQLLRGTNRLSIGRITFFAFQSDLAASMNSYRSLVTRHLEL